MKIKFCLNLIIFILVLLFVAKAVWAQGESSVELIENAQAYQGKLVTYVGEVIGDVMVRGQFAWVNLNDGNNAIGVWLPVALTKEINFSGSYKSQGDILEVSGEFHAVCIEHGGDLDLHAQTLRKIKEGCFMKQAINSDKINAGLVLLGALISIWILNKLKTK